ncbi:hypothetical protein DS2_02925 [Catenovulum agarivorans DS-2]|uniref:3-keto-alpha-glucoside-1,2-lyase/3-keto-2-hydroxy-glucal hydratase domain-containing protein n=1 Tax=Catenovulum agarivorans DS-2 TaxID=1328313 RepID=W7QRV0_9ALTE|nr:DUF1080 domain-containing protein [Catenovulum agarivorans]EWH11742.1 hypothetical protein DS2_02925 [Catenovulum agarivorans DS-2]
MKNKTRHYKSLVLLLLGINILGCNNSPSLISQNQQNWQNVYPYGQANFNQDTGEVELISTGNWFYLTKEKYSDFVLELEVKMPDVKEYSNSGIIFRANTRPSDKFDGHYAYGYQAEIDPSKRKWSGGLYEQGTARQWLHPIHPERSAPDDDFKQNLSPEWTEAKANAYKHLEWNHYKISAIGPEIKIWVNDVLTTHVIDTKSSEGLIGIQHHGSWQFKQNGDTSNTVLFRNIRIEEK